MEIRKAFFVLLLLTASAALFVADAQAPKAPTKDAPKAAAPAAKAAPAAAKAAPKGGATQVQANLGQLMKGILYINANVIFAAQGTDPAKYPQAKDASVSTDALSSTYGKWEAVENSSLAIFEAANLLSLPGRKCANGRAVPTGNADWPGLVQGLRDAANVSLKAAQAKDQDKVLDAADAITTACANCHDKYREKTPRCQ